MTEEAQQQNNGQEVQAFQGSPVPMQRINRVIRNHVNEEGFPRGGSADGLGIHIQFQDGPIKENGRNGCQVEELLQICQARLEFLNTARNCEFQSTYNDTAIDLVGAAISALHERTKEREGQGIEGTNLPEKVVITMDPVPPGWLCHWVPGPFKYSLRHRYPGTGDPSWTVVSGLDNASFLIETPSNDNGMQVQVRAESDAGPGPWSDPLTYRAGWNKA